MKFLEIASPYLALSMIGLSALFLLLGVLGFFERSSHRTIHKNPADAPR